MAYNEHFLMLKVEQHGKSGNPEAIYRPDERMHLCRVMIENKPGFEADLAAVLAGCEKCITGSRYAPTS